MIPTFSESLPSEWVEKRLKYAAPLRIERVEATSEHRAYLGLENVQSWTGKLLPTEVDESAAGKDSEGGTANSFQKDDVLFGKLRPYLAKVFHADKGGVSSTEFLVLKPQPEVRPEFLLYSMLSPEFVGLVNASTFGAKMPRANWDFIGSMSIPVPDLDIQQRIANYLDRETAHIDALIAEKERMLTLLEEKRAALISQAVTRGLDPDVALKPSGLNWLGDIPAHWEIRRGKYLFSQSALPVFDDDEIVTCFRDGTVTLRRNRREEGFTNAVLELGYQGIREGQLVLHSMDAFAGAIGISDSDGKCSPEYIICNPKTKEVICIYFGVLLRLMALRGYIQAACPAVRERAPRIRFSHLSNMFLPLPTTEEQLQIVSFLQDERDKTSEVEDALVSSISLLKERRSALITAAVTGQITPKDMAA